MDALNELQRTQPSLVLFLPATLSPYNLMPPPGQAETSSRPPTTSHGQHPSIDDYEGDTFSERQRSHFSKLLREKWECQQEGHVVCVPTDDGQHFQLAEHNIEQWVRALCRGAATTADPPHSIFDYIGGGAVFNHTTGELKVRAVSIAPSRRKPGPHHLPIGTSARSIDSTVAIRASGNSLDPTWEASTLETTTSSSSGVPGPGYFGGKVIKWLGEKGLNTIQYTIILRRAKVHRSCLDRWAKHQPKLGVREREQVFEMLSDALEMSRQSYTTRVNNVGYRIGRAVHHWLHAYNDIPKTRETLSWLIQVHVSLVPILLTRISLVDPLAGDLAHRTLSTLTRVPLAVQDIETTARVIWHVARELAYSKCTFQHSWLGIWLLRIVEMSLRLRCLTHTEIKAIKELAVRREEQPTEYGGKEGDVWRPWEVALFAQCASQDSWFKEVVVGAHGLPSLIAALDTMCAVHVQARDVHWENVALTLRALAFLSEQEWVAGAVDPPIIRSLLLVFRRSIPERWFCIRYWAADTIRNMVAHRPSLARTLLQEDAISAFETLTNPQLDPELSASPSKPNRQRQPNVPPVPPVAPIPIPIVPPTPQSPQSPVGSSSFPIHNSPQDIPTLLPPSPTEAQRPSSSSSTSSGPPITPLSVTSDRRFHGFPTRRPSQSSATYAVHRASTSSRGLEFSQSPTQPHPRRPPSLIPTPAQERLLEDYKIEATKRAKELSVYVRSWTEWTPNKLPTLEAPRLEALGAGVGWLSEWEGAGWADDVER